MILIFFIANFMIMFFILLIVMIFFRILLVLLVVVGELVVLVHRVQDVGAKGSAAPLPATFAMSERLGRC